MDETDELIALETDGWKALSAYGVVAERAGTAYSALVSSAYIRRDRAWRLALHQQTPR